MGVETPVHEGAPSVSRGAEVVPEASAELVGRALLESGLSAIIVLDAAGRILEFSAAAEEMFGVERDAMLGRELATTLVPEPLRDRHRLGIRGYLATRRTATLDRRSQQIARRADGTEFPIELSITHVAGSDPPVFVGFLRDISSRVRAEQGLARSQALLAEAEELAQAGSFESDLRGTAVELSDGVARVLGLSHLGRRPRLRQALELVHPEDRAAARRAVSSLLEGAGESLLETLRIVRPDGAQRSIELSAKLVRDDRGEPTRLLGTIRDVTEQIEDRRARDLLSYVVESSDDAIITKDRDGTITSWNRGAQRLYGYTAEEAVGQSIRIVVPPDRLEEQAEIQELVFGGEPVERLETERVRHDGTRVCVSLTISPVRDEGGRIVSAAVIARDVTERRRYEQRLRYLAEHDHLTGLFNRHRFDAELVREIARAGRTGEGGAVISVDLDEFKAVNDSAGHAAGDAVLRDVAAALRGHTRETDIVARFGGDEFAVLLPGVDRQEAQTAAEHLLDALHACSVLIEGVPFRVNASLGVVLFDGDVPEQEQLIVSADLAMYAAKQQGRDRIVVFTTQEAAAVRAGAQLSWSQRIRDALENDGLELHWQAIVDSESGHPSHGELLLRMRSDGTLLAPGEFLAAAERLGLIHAIDRWVVRQAIGLLAREEGPGELPLSVNLSGESVAGDPDLLGLIERELDTVRADPSKLIFEVTETAAIANIVEARRFAVGVHRLGCRIALDDFGTGFGSFYHLKHLPVDFIKIDREFVENLPDSGVDQRLVRSIVEVAQSLGIRTVAESVGDDRTVELLRDLGVDYLQGFHLGQPTPLS